MGLPCVEHKQNITIGPRYQVRLEDLRERRVVEITCGRCGRQGKVYPATLRRKLPGHTKLLDLVPRFTCRARRNREGNTWRILALSRNG